MSFITIPLVSRDGQDAGVGELEYGPERGRCVVRFRRGELELSTEGPDYFEALCQVRLRLEEVGLLVASYGGSRTVWPSGMARDMGAGLRAYRLTLGKPPGEQDLVDIFSSGPGMEPATVGEQRAFFIAWLSSIGGLRPGTAR